MSDNVVRELVVRLGVNVEKEKFNAADALVDGLASRLQHFAKGAAAAAVGLATWSVHTAASLNDLSNRVGIGTQDLQGLQHAANLSGSSADTMSRALDVLTRTIGEAAAGNKTAQKAFSDLGVRFVDTNGKARKTSDVLNGVADAIAKIDTPAKKAAAATAVFSKAGVELVPTLNGGARGLARMRNEVVELGASLDSDFVQASVAAGDTVQKLRLVALGVGGAIAKAVLPHLQKMANGLLQWWKISGDIVRQRIGAAFDAFGQSVDYAGRLLRPFVDLFMGLSDVLELIPDRTKVVLGLIAAIKLLNPVTLIGGLFLLVLEDIYTFAVGGKSVIGDFFKFMSQDTWATTWIGLFHRVARVAASISTTMLNLFSGVIGAAVSVGHGDFSGAFRGIKDTIGTQREIMQDVGFQIFGPTGLTGDVGPPLSGAGSVTNASIVVNANTNASPHEIGKIVREELKSAVGSAKSALVPQVR